MIYNKHGNLLLEGVVHMQWFSQLKIKQKLGLLVGMLSLGILIVGGVGYWSLKQSNLYLDSMYDNNMMQAKLAYKNQILLGQLRGEIFELMLMTSEADNQRLLQQISQDRMAYTDTFTQLGKICRISKEKICKS